MTRLLLRRFVNGLGGLIPPSCLRFFLKIFLSRPDLALRAGFQVSPLVFYSPLPNPAEIDLARLREKRELPDLPIDTPAAVRLLTDLAVFTEEIGQFPRDAQDPRMVLWHHTYPTHDTAVLYAMLRKLKPKRYIEIGCGYSSRASSAAILRNRAEGFPCHARYIEPYPAAHLDIAGLAGEFLRKKVEQIPLEIFRELESGDALFIDTSHVLKTQNDVEYEFTRILPALRPGITVHIHDIFTPYDYPEEWIVNSDRFCGGNNEQYLLEAFLGAGDNWKVVLPVYLLWRDRRDALRVLWPETTSDRPASFWIEKLKSFRP
jgi:hypothetical protein